MSAVILGVPLDDVTETGALDVIGTLIADGRQNERSHQITTVNVDFVVNARGRPDLMTILQRSSLNLADGAPLVWASTMFGDKLSERVAGADLFGALCAASASRGWRVHVLGGAPGVGDRALAMLLEKHPDAQITVDPGPVLSDPAEVPSELLDDIEARDPDILCVALGNPKQEYFIDAHRQRLKCPVMIGVGGSMDMMVGDRRRAPRWVQRIGAEWVFRAMQEPRRLGPRYFADLRVFVPAIVRSRGDVRGLAERGSDLVIRVEDDRITASPLPLGASDDSTTTRPPEWSQLLVSDLPVHLNLAGCTKLTPSGHAAACSLFRVASRFGRRATVVGWNDELRECFDRFGTAEWVEEVVGFDPTPVTTAP